MIDTLGLNVSENAALANRRITLYVDSVSQHWVVLDREGNFWLLPNAANPWEGRQLIFPTAETVLIPVPGHYIHMLGLPT